jgi:hypothetical protein
MITAEMMQVYGFSLKSSCPILTQVYRKEFGVAVDHHLGRASLELCWVLHYTTDKEEMVVMIQDWLPKEYWLVANNTIGGLNQLFQTKKHKPIVISVAKEIGAANLVECLLLFPPPPPKNRLKILHTKYIITHSNILAKFEYCDLAEFM